MEPRNTMESCEVGQLISVKAGGLVRSLIPMFENKNLEHVWAVREVSV